MRRMDTLYSRHAGVVALTTLRRLSPADDIFNLAGDWPVWQIRSE